MAENMEKTAKCPQCGRNITDDEFVVNWGTCGACFDAHYCAYLEARGEKNMPATEAEPGTKWVRYPGPGEYRGEGTWRTIADAGVTAAEWEEIKDTGWLPTHEGDEPPKDGA